MHHAVALAAFATAAAAVCQEPPSLRWQQDEHALALLCDGEVLWRFRHDPASPHASFHPLSLPGTKPLTVAEPADHVWHHGLWFSWKYIDGVNYWEHPAGADRPVGRSRFEVETLEHEDDGSARVVMRVTYAPDDGATPVLEESRTIEVRPPAADGSYAIDWTGRFTARAERVVLDRTPIPGQPGGAPNGGYAGLAVRLASFADRAAATTGGPVEWNEHERFRGRARAFDYHGTLDGREVGVAVLAHPDNQGGPSPWYAVRSKAMAFYTAAFLCYGPRALARGDTLTLRYRVLVHPGRFDADRLAAAQQDFAATAAREVELVPRGEPESNPRRSDKEP
jgi:hypothetical protein